MYVYALEKNPEMIKMPSLLLIGGTKRKIGKTTLAEMVIEKFGEANEIIGVKISNMKPGEEDFHGFHEHILHEKYTILKEYNGGKKDSQRMIGSGAQHAYFIRVQDESLDEAFQALLQEIGNNSIIVCESNSLRNIVEPGLFFMVHEQGSELLKAESEKLLTVADIRLNAHDYPHFSETANRLQLLKTGWTI